MGIIAKNKNALFNYEVLETYQAGIVLSGPEVKSVKTGHIQLKGSYVTIDANQEVWLIGAYISPYKPAAHSQTSYHPNQRRKLLLNKKEINSLMGKTKQKGLTIIPISVYTNKRLIKIDLALARGKTRVDKRETIKKRETAREINRALRSKNNGR